MKNFLLALIIFSFISVNYVKAQQQISVYSSFLGYSTGKSQTLISLRKFSYNGKTKILAVDINTLNTVLLDSSLITITKASWENIFAKYKKSAYVKALQKAKQQAIALQDAGLIHGYPKAKGITLTIDLCPSHKPLDKQLFKSMINAYKNIENPVPLALSISGKFLLSHQEDVAWLNKLQATNQIKITWINHTYNHYYNPSAPLTQNFLLKPGTSITNEVEDLEKLLFSEGMLPSIFFRFPGLVSDQNIVNSIINLGLIPIGTDAWLAKGQKAENGSIVLIHGNGNEPVGVKDFLNLLNTDKAKILKKQWLLYDLNTTISQNSLMP